MGGAAGGSPFFGTFVLANVDSDDERGSGCYSYVCEFSYQSNRVFSKSWNGALQVLHTSLKIREKQLT